MSSLPGLTLEDFLAWNYDLIVDGDGSANPSLSIAEALGTSSIPRKNITGQLFAALVTLFEPHRELVEERLGEFDGETQSWRDYAGVSFDFISQDTYRQGKRLLNSLLGMVDGPPPIGSIEARVNQLEHAQVDNVRRLGKLEASEKDMTTEIVGILEANTALHESLGGLEGAVAGDEADLNGLRSRIEALEKHSHEPQDIEPRVIRCLKRMGILRPARDRWFINPSTLARWACDEIDAVEIGDHADPAPATVVVRTGLENFFTAGGAELDALADRLGVKPPRAKGESDWAFRNRIQATLPRWQHQHDTRVRGREPGQPVEQFYGLGVGAFDRQESLADDYGVPAAEFPAPIHRDGLGRLFTIERRNGEEYRIPVPDEPLPRRPSTLSAAEAGALTASLEYWRWLDKLMEPRNLTNPPPEVVAFLEAMELLVRSRALEDVRPGNCT